MSILDNVFLLSHPTFLLVAAWWFDVWPEADEPWSNFSFTSSNVVSRLLFSSFSSRSFEAGCCSARCRYDLQLSTLKPQWHVRFWRLVCTWRTKSGGLKKLPAKHVTHVSDYWTLFLRGFSGQFCLFGHCFLHIQYIHTFTNATGDHKYSKFM